MSRNREAAEEQGRSKAGMYIPQSRSRSAWRCAKPQARRDTDSRLRRTDVGRQSADTGRQRVYSRGSACRCPENIRSVNDKYLGDEGDYAKKIDKRGFEGSGHTHARTA